MPSALLIEPPAVDGVAAAGSAVAGSPPDLSADAEAEACAEAGLGSAPLVATGFAARASVEAVPCAVEAFEQALIRRRAHANVIIRFISMTSRALSATDVPVKKP